MEIESMNAGSIRIDEFTYAEYEHIKIYSSFTHNDYKVYEYILAVESYIQSLDNLAAEDQLECKRIIELAKLAQEQGYCYLCIYTD
jgi:tRNA U54 and U55 pseudouridine synthase Pus10